MFRKTSTAAAAVALGVLALAGCSDATGSDDASSSTPGSGGDARAPQLNLGMVDAPGQGGFVAANMSFATKSPYGQAVYDTLIRATPTNDFEPSLATSWEFSDDGMVLTLAVRDDVLFTDGTPFTAEVAAQNLLRFRDGSAENAVWLAGVTDVTALDETTVVITLAAPDPSLLLNLTKAAGYMESPASFDDEQPVGTGPYLLDESRTVTDATYVFTANDDYWAPEYQHYDEIVMSVYEDPVAMQNALLGNQIDAVVYTGSDGFEQIEAAGYTAYDFMQDWEGILLSDRDGALNPALGDVRVRQAINYAMDRDGLLAALGAGRGEVTTQIFGVDTPGYQAELDGAYPYDPARARELLADAGFADGLEIELPSVAFVPAATFDLLGQQLAEVGITATFTEVAPQDYFGALLGGQFAAATMRLEQPASAWDTYTLEIAPFAPWNAFRVEDEWVAELAARIQTGDDSAQAADALNEYMVEQAWFAPWFRKITTLYGNDSVDVTLQTGNVYPYLWNIVPTQS